MKVVLQRVRQAKVMIEDEDFSSIEHGFLLLVGIEKGDTKEEADYLVKKIANIRIFEDENPKMNRSLSQVGGEILSVSQFTLLANTKKGNRPSFERSAARNEAIALYDYFNESLREVGYTVKTGQFGADMQVSLTNDGPVTIIFDTKEAK